MALHLSGIEDATEAGERVRRLGEELREARLPVQPIARAALGARIITGQLLSMSFVEREAIMRRERQRRREVA